MEIVVKLILIPTLALALLGSACSEAPQEQAKAQPESSAPATLEPQSPSAMHSYRCESGETIDVSYPSTEAATIRYKGQNHEMKIAVSGSGARYTGNGLEWWGKGSGAGSAGTLFRHLADGTTGESVETCVGS